jgi:hypothetical protein
VQEKKKIHCNTCKRDTNHELKYEHHKNDYDVADMGGEHEQVIFYENIEYGFYVCLGCDTASIEERYHCAGMYNNNGDDVYSTSYSPERNNKYVREPKKFLHIDNKLKTIYIELIKASNNNLETMCSMGIRALLEGVCIQEGIGDDTAWGLKKKIEALKKKSNIPDGIIEALMSLKIIGDDAAHRLMPTDKQNINLSLDVIEALLINLYEAKFDLEHKANLVRKAHNKKMQPTA